MFNRRMFVALAVCLAVSASSVFANGNGNGTKKDSHIQVKNESQDSLYAFVGVAFNDILDAADSDDPASAFEELGGKPIESGGSADFSVIGGTHKLTVVDADLEDVVFVDRSVTVKKGQTKKVFVHDTDLPVDNTGT